MDRRTFIGRLTGAVLAAPRAAEAQAVRNVARIGYLAGGSPASAQAFVDAFRQGLREFGWIEGQNIVVDYRFAEGRYDRLPELATELVRLKVDVIVTGSPSPAVAAKHATATIPIVMSGVGDPVGLGLIASLARPGGNVTGLSFSVGLDSFSKSLEFIKQLVPDVRSVAVLTNPTNPAQAIAVKDMQVAARSLGMQLQLVEARSPDDFDGAFAAIAKERAAALLVVTEPMLVLHQTRLTALAVKQRLPTMYGIRESVEAGGLMSYGPNLTDIYRRAAIYVDRILKGARPADLPVEQPTKFELVINLKTAKALGLTIPQSLLLRADEVIQ